MLHGHTAAIQHVVHHPLIHSAASQPTDGTHQYIDHGARAQRKCDTGAVAASAASASAAVAAVVVVVAVVAAPGHTHTFAHSHTRPHTDTDN